MVATRTPVKFTYAEYRTLPDPGPRYQLIEGELVMSPSPNFRHQAVVANLFGALFAHVKALRLGVVACAPLDVILSEETVVQPDIVFVSLSRRSIIVTEGLRGAPDLCVEVLSGRTEDLDRGAKRLLYSRHGVIEYWITDPERNTVDVYRLQENPAIPVRTLGISDTLASSLLPGFSLALADVFAS